MIVFTYMYCDLIVLNALFQITGNSAPHLPPTSIL